MVEWMKDMVRSERWEELLAHLCWMGLVVAAIYGVENTALSEDWRRAIGEGIGIFGGVELILDKINDVRRARAVAEAVAKAERESSEARAKAAQEVAEARAKAAQEVADARVAAAEAQAKAAQEAAEAQAKAAREAADARDAAREAAERASLEAIRVEREALRADREAARAEIAERENAELRRRVEALERQANGGNHKE